MSANERAPSRFPARAVPAAVMAPARPASQARAAPTAPAGLGLDSAAVRQAMVQRLASLPGIESVVLAALAEVPRHAFVDPALANQAYQDTSLPIGLGQTISKPSVVARMLSLLLQGRAEPPAKALEIGTGCGYQAALLARLCGTVVSVERLKGLHDKARTLLRPLALRNLHLVLADGTQGYPSYAPYDVIVAAAAGPEVPAAWLAQLAPGGTLVAPVQVAVGKHVLRLVKRTRQGWQQTDLEEVRFVPLKFGVI